ncbi:MAG: Type 1 glutamine amidotransferase-like domain-containing protein [Candidatus Moranbacteria bacterium]|nr:Type 1 glutamine amidotransferase-like domain-containing protein [Candidatus Moranbacteria bacterium]
MKLLLTSTGLTNENVRKFFISQFDRLDKKTTCVITSGRTKKEQYYIDESVRELSDLGIKVTELNIARNDVFPYRSTFDIYYVCGGNTFYILDRMRKTKIDRFLIDAVVRGKFYLGVSAGSIIPGPDIEISGWGEAGDPNDINLQDLTGFGLVPYLIVPHYTEQEKADVEAFKKKRKGESVIELTDDQAIFVEDEKMVRI